MYCSYGKLLCHKDIPIIGSPMARRLCDTNVVATLEREVVLICQSIAVGKVLETVARRVKAERLLLKRI